MTVASRTDYGGGHFRFPTRLVSSEWITPQSSLVQPRLDALSVGLCRRHCFGIDGGRDFRLSTGVITSVSLASGVRQIRPTIIDLAPQALTVRSAIFTMTTALVPFTTLVPPNRPLSSGS